VPLLDPTMTAYDHDTLKALESTRSGWPLRGTKHKRKLPMSNSRRTFLASVALGSLRHGIGGAIGDTSEAKKSVDWHLVYDPTVDRWEQRAPLPTHASAPSRCVPFIRSHASRALWYPASWHVPPLARSSPWGLGLIVVETPMQKGSLWVFRHRGTSLSEEGTSDHRPGV
jgi:hypothetical protein